MNIPNWVAVISAIISIITCAVNFMSVISSRTQSRQTEGQAMLALRSTVEQSKASVGELIAQQLAINDETPLSKRTARDKKRLITLESRIRAAIESQLNIYDTACTAYLERRYNHRLFKKNFHHEICGLVESKDTWHKGFFFPGEPSNYKSILKVYKAWKHPE